MKTAEADNKDENFLKDSANAIIFLILNMGRWNLRWIDKVKENISNYEDFAFDVKADVARVRTKV